MNLFISFFLGFRYFFSKSNNFFNKLTNVLSIISMSFGISSVITIISVMNGFENEFKNNILNFVPHIVISGIKNSMNKYNIKKDNIVSKYIAHVSEIITSDVVVQSSSEISMGSVLSMHDKQYTMFTPYLTNSNSVNCLKKNYYNAIMGKGLANKLNIDIGDTFRLITPNVNQFSLFGNIPNKRMFRLIDTFVTDNEIDNYQILVNQKDLSNFLHYPKNHITGLRLWLKNPLDVENYLKDFHFSNVVVEDWKHSEGEILQAIKLEKYMMTLLFSLIVIVSIFSLVVSINLFIMDKERDIAILQTLGLSRYNIMLIFIFQALFSGIIGILLGTLLSFFIVNETIGIVSIIKLFFVDFVLPYSIVPSQIMIINLASIICIISFIIYPSWKSATIPPSKRLAYE
ncbi:MAG: FtsX-like permease family protein [Buchnera aphidicola (Meitanaphis elongallis)]